MPVIEANSSLTCGQRWLVSLFETSADLARPVQRIYRLRDDFDLSAFMGALESVVNRHPALRLRIMQTAEGWRQSFPEQPALIDCEEIQGRSPEMRAAYAAFLLSNEAKLPLDLRKDSPVKVKIIRYDATCLLSLCIDHLASDETGFNLIEEELISSYGKAQDGELLQRPPSDAFFVYLATEVARADAERDNLAYWREQLCDARTRESGGDQRFWVPGTSLYQEFGGDTFQRLQRFCVLHKCTLFNLVVAVQLLVVMEVGNLEDVVLNIPVSNRIGAAERAIVGNLAMLLHVRFQLQAHESPDIFVRRVRDRLLSAMAHRQYEYTSLRREIQGGPASEWLIGCNYLAQDRDLPYPNRLFQERLDNLPGGNYDVPRGSFIVSACQMPSSIRISVDWDAQIWPVSNGDLELKFLNCIEKYILHVDS